MKLQALFNNIQPRLGVFMLMLCLLVPTTISAQPKREKKTELNGFVWYKLSEGSYEGAEDANGKTLIPLSMGYTLVGYSAPSKRFYGIKNNMMGYHDETGKEIISPDRGYDHVMDLRGFIRVSRGDKVGACDLSGMEVISPDKGYDDILFCDNYYKVERNGKQGVCDLAGKEIVAPIYDYILYSDGVYKYQDAGGHFWPVPGTLRSFASSSSSTTTSISTDSYPTSSKIKREKHKAPDGFVWYRVYDEKNRWVYGFEDKDHKIIIPLNRGYTYVNYSWFGMIEIEKNKKKGICDLAGKEIISPDRGYDEAFVLVDGIFVKRSGKSGLCDYSGNEIVATIYDGQLVFIDHVLYHKDTNDKWESIPGISPCYAPNYDPSSSNANASRSYISSRNTFTPVTVNTYQSNNYNKNNSSSNKQSINRNSSTATQTSTYNSTSRNTTSERERQTTQRNTTYNSGSTRTRHSSNSSSSYSSRTSETTYSSSTSSSNNSSNSRSSVGNTTNTKEHKKCLKCNGSGKVNCYTCKGRGHLTCKACKGTGYWTQKGVRHNCNACRRGTIQCYTCVGKGTVKCISCSGKGYH